MARPCNITPTVRFFPQIPQDLAAKILATLHSDIEGRIPLGAISAFFTQLVREHFARQENRDAGSDLHRD